MRGRDEGEGGKDGTGDATDAPSHSLLSLLLARKAGIADTPTKSLSLSLSLSLHQVMKASQRGVIRVKSLL